MPTKIYAVERAMNRKFVHCYEYGSNTSLVAGAMARKTEKHIFWITQYFQKYVYKKTNMGSGVFVYCLKYLRGRETSTVFLPDHSLLSITGRSLGGGWRARSRQLFVSLASALLLGMYIGSRASKSKHVQRLRSVLKVRIPHSRPSHKVTFSGVFTLQMSVISVFIIIVILQPAIISQSSPVFWCGQHQFLLQ